MIQYNWIKIKEATNGISTEVLLVIHTLTYNLTPKNYRDPLYKYWNKNWFGFSFLVNPEAIFEHRPEYSEREWIEYITLASYRNVNLFNDNGETTLDLKHSPVREDIIKNNRLLKVENNKIRFRYEEVTQIRRK